ncbi:MAG: tRNA pseudouridine(55) synthase TruB [Bacteroidales bacterium]|nr:tRNA pseudouridine(55) synthase TruB [Bacteroidales bacterium]
MSFLVPAPGAQISHDIADYPDGIVIPVNKPLRWTSADVIRKLKFAAIKHFGKKNLKVGHAGTLDPLATGILLVCIGPACRMAQSLQDTDKEYIALMRFGATTPSYDLEKPVDRMFPYEHITEEAVRAALPSFLGEQEQVAPLFSAKSVDGVRAYELARKLYRSGSGNLDTAALETLHRSRITISELELLNYLEASFSEEVDSPETVSGESTSSEKSTASSRIHFEDTSALGLPEATIRIACSKGTYIRAFARDLGEALGSGAHLAGLIRSRSGSFRLSDALTMDQAMELFR